MSATVLASGTRGVTGSTSTLLRGSSLRVQLDVTDSDGTAETLDVKVQDSLDGTNWNDLLTFVQATGATREVKNLTTPFAELVRVLYTVGGTDTEAVLSTNLAGANNDLVFTGAGEGADGNAITVRYVDPAANNAAIGVVVVGSAITVNLATDGSGVITSTAANVKTAIDATPAAAALVSVANKAANDGTGVVTALAATPLAGGEDVGFTFSVVASVA